MNQPQYSTFEDTFGENRGNDFLFFQDEDDIKQEPLKVLTPQDILNELDLLTFETLDRDSIEKNLDKVISWFDNNIDVKQESEFLGQLPEKFSALFASIEEQLRDLDYNSVSRLKRVFGNMNQNELLKPLYEEYNQDKKLSKAVEDRLHVLLEEVREKSKQIQKAKKVEKKKKLYQTEKYWKKDEKSDRNDRSDRDGRRDDRRDDRRDNRRDERRDERHHSDKNW